MMSSILELSTTFSMSYDCVTMTVTYVTGVTLLSLFATCMT